MHERQRDPVLRLVQPGGASGMLRRAVCARGPVAVPEVPGGHRRRRGMLHVPRPWRRSQADKRRSVGSCRLRAVDPRGWIRQHRASGTGHKAAPCTSGSSETNLCGLQ